MLEKYYWELLAKKLAGEASPRELEEFEHLCKMYPHLLSSIAPLEEIWHTPTPIEEAEVEFENLMNQMKEDESLEPIQKPSNGLIKRFWIPFSVAASVVLIIGLSFLFNDRSIASKEITSRIDAKMQTRQFFCPAGSKTKLVLPDSSMVWLNSGTKLTYNDGYGINNRDITLTGEAFFDVRKSEMPFIIKTANIKIKVLGTAFNVRSYPHEKRSETSLLRGSVEVTLDERPNQRIVLKPSEKITIKHDAPTLTAKASIVQEPLIVLTSVTKTIDSAIVETLWVDNKLSFRSETFAALAKRMEIRYGVRIVFEDEQLKQQRFTGSFTDESITEMLEALQYSHAFHYLIHDNTIEISH